MSYIGETPIKTRCDDRWRARTIFRHIESKTMADVRRDCLSNAFGPNTAQLLNVSERTVAAWRAHETMGTYKERA